MSYHYKKDLKALMVQIEESDDRKQLLSLWPEFYIQPVPKGLSTKLLRLAIIYRIKEKLHGGLQPAIHKYLFQLAKANNKAAQLKLPVKSILKPGSHLIRQWRGETYQVKMVDNGYEYNGKVHKSLSEIARSITGIHLNGPKFFGLRKSTIIKERQPVNSKHADMAS